MSLPEKEEQLIIFLNVARNAKHSKKIFDNIYKIISKYGLPENCLDRSFAFDCMIGYFSEIEDYEKCAALLKQKLEPHTTLRITYENLTRDELVSLTLLGITTPEWN
jgi:hypothetical protein